MGLGWVHPSVTVGRHRCGGRILYFQEISVRGSFPARADQGTDASGQGATQVGSTRGTDSDAGAASVFAPRGYGGFALSAGREEGQLDRATHINNKKILLSLHLTFAGKSLRSKKSTSPPDYAGWTTSPPTVKPSILSPKLSKTVKLLLSGFGWWLLQ